MADDVRALHAVVQYEFAAHALLARFAGVGDEPMRLLLMFLMPLAGGRPITLREGR